MPYFVAPGKSITTPGGTLAGGDPDSEVTWQKLCKNTNDPARAESAKAQIPRLVACGAIVEADTMPMSPKQTQAAEAREKITETVALSSPAERATPEKTAAKPPKAEKHSVPLSEDAEKAAKAKKDGPKGGAKKAD